MTMSRISTHILDTATGRPAAGVSVVLEGAPGSGHDPDAQDRDGQDAPAWVRIAAAVTDGNGRVVGLGPSDLAPGEYRLRFDTGAYFVRSSVETFFPEVTIAFNVVHSDQHYHVPLLISPFAYSTYRGN
jgi:5-hydroxyisourate hydrolase